MGQETLSLCCFSYISDKERAIRRATEWLTERERERERENKRKKGRERERERKERGRRVDDREGESEGARIEG